MTITINPKYLILKVKKNQPAKLDSPSSKAYESTNYRSCALEKGTFKLISLASPKGWFKDKQKIIRYWNMVVNNKKQKKMSMARAGLNKVAISAGTNKGTSRQKYANFGYKTQKTSSPNHLGGRLAHRYIKNQTKLKINRKQKKEAIRLLFYYLFKKAQLYFIKDEPETELTITSSTLKEESTPNLKIKTSDFLKNLKNQSRGALLKIFTNKVKNGPVLFMKQKYSRFFRNLNCLNLDKSTSYFGLYNGARLRKVLLFDQTMLEKLQSLQIIKKTKEPLVINKGALLDKSVE